MKGKIIEKGPSPQQDVPKVAVGRLHLFRDYETRSTLNLSRGRRLEICKPPHNRCLVLRLRR